MISFFGDDAETPAHLARLFWNATIDPSVLQAAAESAQPHTQGQFDLFDLPVEASVLVLADREELLLGQGNRTIRLSVRTGSLLSGPVVLEFRTRSTDALIGRSAALQRFAAFQISRAGSIGATRAGSATRRLMLLRTLDALANDTRHRQVAMKLFGSEQVEASWSSASDHLRSRVRRLIQQARALALGDSATFFASRDTVRTSRVRAGV